MIYLNDKQLNVTVFPDNTSQIWKLDQEDLEYPFAIIKWVYLHEGEFLQIAQLKELLDLHNVEARLHISYLPYARQDKEVSNQSTFALIPFAKLLNSLNFKEVVINDPHSYKAIQLIDRSRATFPIDVIARVLSETKCDMFCYPDKGAVNKYTSVYNEFRKPTCYGEKVRDQLTGNITSYKLVGNPSGKNVLIIDDICDGGMTFKILAKDLLAAGAKSVVLFVTHGIFSKGVRTLKEAGIQKVFTSVGEASDYEGSIMYRKLS